MIYILGIGSFIGRNFYLRLKKLQCPVFCLNHHEISLLSSIKNDDTIINFCGVNRGKTSIDYDEANYFFIKNVMDIFTKYDVTPFFIHISSLMVNGFLNQSFDDLPEYQKYFIQSKLNAENYLSKHYPKNKLCIVRPSNIYGYDCEPYKNNLLVTLIFEKITQKYQTVNINKNCLRNFLSIDGLCDQLMTLMQTQKSGIYNLVSNNNINLQSLIEILYEDQKPLEINFLDGELSQPGDSRDGSETICIEENFSACVSLTEQKMRHFLNISDEISIQRLRRLSQPRGDMVEVSDLQSQRLYMITLTDHSIRGNHFHFQQIEHFYMNHGRVIYLLAHKDHPEVIVMKILDRDDSIVIKPLIIHTLVNDFINNECEIFVASTQSFIPNQVPDTEYVQIVPY
jgi:nucleoside-diphosphate-sugar epimerase